MTERNYPADMERVLELEREHVQLHVDLLKALDKLYLAQKGHGNVRDREMETSLATRRQLQLSLEKSAAILRAMERLSKLETGHGNDFKTTEDLLASRLNALMQENYELDYKVKELLRREDEISQSFREERNQYFQLVSNMTEVSDKIHAQKREKPSHPRPTTLTDQEKASQQRIIDQNQQIEELLLALKIHGGYDPLG